MMNKEAKLVSELALTHLLLIEWSNINFGLIVFLLIKLNWTCLSGLNNIKLSCDKSLLLQVILTTHLTSLQYKDGDGQGKKNGSPSNQTHFARRQLQVLKS